MQQDLRAKLARAPDASPARGAAIERGVADSVAYLASDAALRSIAVDPYWPKWHSPWWHMLLLHELGETQRIPARVADAMTAAIDRLLHTFPLRPEDAPGADPYRDVACHCALGTMYQVLAGRGVDVDRALPWVRPWFVRYQMTDGGLNCDEGAYLQPAECPSSMVAGVAALEAMMLGGAGADEERAFVDRAGRFLLARSLTHGSPTAYNAAERAAASAWPRLAFPRFYFYDTLRGLAALVRWAELTEHRLPRLAVTGVVEALLERWPDGVVRVERQAHAGQSTLVPTADRSPPVRGPASTFPLLDAVSVTGEPAEALTLQWSSTRAGLLRLADAGRLE